MEPTSDSGQMSFESQPLTGTPSNPAEKGGANELSSPGPTEASGKPVPATPVRIPPVRRPTPAEIAASVVNLDEASLNAEVEMAMAGAKSGDVSTGATPPSTDEPTTGTIVTGRIANIGSRDVLIDLGLKSFGAMPLAEVVEGEKLAIGDAIEVQIVESDPRSGLLSVSRRKARQTSMVRSLKPGLVVEGRVTGMNKGGLEMEIEGLRGFIPASQVDVRFRKDISELIGQKISAEVTKVDFSDDEPNIVLSRRNCLMREEEERKEKMLTELDVGQIRRGRVRGLTDFGAFVDLGGVDGLLHVSDMSWGRVAKAEDVVKVGDEIEVMITKVNRQTKKISLSLRQTLPDPWLLASQKYTVGMRLRGRIARLANFGAFVELEPGVDALLPVSEMSWTKRVRNPSEVVKEGDIVEVSVLSFDGENKRISLSLKAMTEDPWSIAVGKYAVGTTLRAKVARTADFGAFVQLEDGIDGLVHISEISEERIRAVTDKVKPGDEVEVRVLAVDPENKKISLSMKKPPAQPSPEEIAAAQAARAAAEKKKPAKLRRGGLTFEWDQGLGSLDPTQFSR